MKIRIYFFALLAIGLFSACGVTIPGSDRTPPTFIFEITNGLPGGLLRITSGDDLSNKQLNLRRNTLYRFRYTGSDAGGLAALKLRVNWPTNFIELGPPSAEYAITTDGSFYRELTWLGTRSAAKSGHVVVGQLNTIMYNQSYAVVNVAWEMTASDFGGTSGPSNTISKTLNVGIVDETQELGLIEVSD